MFVFDSCPPTETWEHDRNWIAHFEHMRILLFENEKQQLLLSWKDAKFETSKNLRHRWFFQTCRL